MFSPVYAAGTYCIRFNIYMFKFILDGLLIEVNKLSNL